MLHDTSMQALRHARDAAFPWHRRLIMKRYRRSSRIGAAFLLPPPAYDLMPRASRREAALLHAFSSRLPLLYIWRRRQMAPFFYARRYATLLPSPEV